MTAPTNGFKVDFDELFAHAKVVLQLQQPLDQVVAATKAASPNGFDVAYGVACQGWALLLMPVREHAEDVVGKISRSVGATSDELIKSVDTYDGSEQKHAQQLRALGADLPTTNNPLIAAGTKFDWKNYDPTRGGVWTQTDTPDGRAKGAGLGGNAWELYAEIAEKGNRNYGSMMGHIAAMTADTTSALGDPIAAMTGWATTWMIEHLKPLKLILDSLAGNPEMISAAAETWKRTSAKLDALSKQYGTAVDHGTGGWDGAAGQGYRDGTAKKTIAALSEAGLLAKGMSVVVAISGAAVDAVRATVRDLIGQLVGHLASSAAKRLFLYEPPLEDIKQIADTTRMATRLLKALFVTLDDLASVVPLIIESYKALAKSVPNLDGI